MTPGSFGSEGIKMEPRIQYNVTTASYNSTRIYDDDDDNDNYNNTRHRLGNYSKLFAFSITIRLRDSNVSLSQKWK
jgi:hypothetical protein